MLEWLSFWRLEKADSEKFAKASAWLSFALFGVLIGCYAAGTFQVDESLIVLAAIACGLPVWGLVMYIVLKAGPDYDDPGQARLKVVGWILFPIIWPVMGITVLWMLRRRDAEAGPPSWMSPRRLGLAIRSVMATIRFWGPNWHEIDPAPAVRRV